MNIVDAAIEKNRAMLANRPEWDAMRTGDAAKKHDAAQTNHSVELSLQTTSEPTPKPIPRIKVYSTLNAWALRHKQVNALAAWHLLRAIDTVGNGWVYTSELEARSEPYMKSERLKASLRQAENVGLIKRVTLADGTRVVQMRGLLAVARLLKLESVGARSVYLDADTTRKASTFKAALLAAWHTGHAAKPGRVSRYEIRAETSVPNRTQRTYEKQTKVKATGAIAIQTVETNSLDAIRAGIVAPRRADIFRIRQVNEHQTLIGHRLPNEYKTNLNRARRGNMRRVNTTLRGDLFHDADGKHAAQRKHSRMYFDSEKQASRAGRQEARITGGIPSAFGDAPTQRYVKAQRRTRGMREVYIVLD